jgi:hypothetical protein
MFRHRRESSSSSVLSDLSSASTSRPHSPIVATRADSALGFQSGPLRVREAVVVKIGTRVEQVSSSSQSRSKVVPKPKPTLPVSRIKNASTGNDGPVDCSSIPPGAWPSFGPAPARRTTVARETSASSVTTSGVRASYTSSVAAQAPSPSPPATSARRRFWRRCVSCEVLFNQNCVESASRASAELLRNPPNSRNGLSAVASGICDQCARKERLPRKAPAEARSAPHLHSPDELLAATASNGLRLYDEPRTRRSCFRQSTATN